MNKRWYVFRLLGALSLKELRRSLSGLTAAFIILSVGFIGPLLSISLSASVDRYIVKRSREIFSADLAVSGLRPLKNDERAALGRVLRPHQSVDEVEFVTMAHANSDDKNSAATLVQVKGVAAGFPIFGDFTFTDQSTMHNSEALQNRRVAWVYPEVIAQLGLKTGATVVLGKTEFTVEKVVQAGPGLARMGGFAPLIYIGIDSVTDTGLVQFGSQVYYRTYFALPSGSPPQEVVAAEAKSVLPDPDLFLRTPDDAVSGFERAFSFFKLYLVSISLIVFALSWVSAFYILQVYLQERTRTAGVLLTFGASVVETWFFGACQICLLMFGAFVFASVVAVGAVNLLDYEYANQFPLQFHLIMPLRETAFMGLLALLSSLSFSYPLWSKLRSQQLTELLAENVLAQNRLGWRSALPIYLPLLIIMFGLSVWLMNSRKFAIEITGGIFLAALIGWIVSRITFHAFFALVKRRPGFLRLIATQLVRSRFGVSLCFLTLLISALVVNLVPHLLSSAMNELSPFTRTDQPALFLFNIPELSIDSLQKFAQERNAELRYISPLILGRLMKVNGNPTLNDQFQRFPVRLSVREHPIASEKVVAGQELQPFDPKSQEPAPISMEKGFADRNGFHLGDRIEFDIQGIAVTGKVVNFRQVNWTSFNPNFFMLFSPGVLDDAPKTLIANVVFPGGVRDELKARFQFELVREFPDLNVIDVGRTLSRVLEVVRAVLGPLQGAAWIAVMMSLIILIAVIRHNLNLRREETEVLKVLGVEPNKVLWLLTGEYTCLALIASLAGAGLALGVGYFVVRKVFDIEAVWNFVALGASITVIIIAVALISGLTTRSILQRGQSSKRL